MEDKTIIDLYFARDESAITETDRKYGAFCRRIALNILRLAEDAEECVNDTWYAVWNRVPPEIPQSLSAFLGRITRNLSISRYRANRAKKRGDGLEILLSELEDCIPSPDSVESAAEHRELTEDINRWLASLSPDSRVLFVRRYWYGDAVGKLASEYGCTAAAMAQKLHRLRLKLKEFLSKRGINV